MVLHQMDCVAKYLASYMSIMNVHVHVFFMHVVYTELC